MIGGTDIFIETATGGSAMDCAVRAIRMFWPNAIFENGRTAEIATRYDQLSFLNSSEILIYKDQGAFDQWEALGADPSLWGTMIHLLSDQAGLTLVVDNQPGEDILKIVRSVRHALRMNSFGNSPRQEAA